MSLRGLLSASNRLDSLQSARKTKQDAAIDDLQKRRDKISDEQGMVDYRAQSERDMIDYRARSESENNPKETPQEKEAKARKKELLDNWSKNDEIIADFGKRGGGLEGVEPILTGLQARSVNARTQGTDFNPLGSTEFGDPTRLDTIELEDIIGGNKVAGDAKKADVAGQKFDFQKEVFDYKKKQDQQVADRAAREPKNMPIMWNGEERNVEWFDKEVLGKAQDELDAMTADVNGPELRIVGYEKDKNGTPDFTKPITMSKDQKIAQDYGGMASLIRKRTMKIAEIGVMRRVRLKATAKRATDRGAYFIDQKVDEINAILDQAGEEADNEDAGGQ